ncbi:hypothetical protein KIMH_10650 [Bombiscardovia apis]|uniref:TolA protein n=1 Tax=Bombiscardovia apis TaxID=2932182 RepID=A0ABM8BDH0_9BIFI|nr:hypothetical protein [Bombiscardovia apis]BDR54954.1 hypothetical protein KIMH_10650 [Bombiscardovia apis]
MTAFGKKFKRSQAQDGQFAASFGLEQDQTQMLPQTQGMQGNPSDVDATISGTQPQELPTQTMPPVPGNVGTQAGQPPLAAMPPSVPTQGAGKTSGPTGPNHQNSKGQKQLPWKSILAVLVALFIGFNIGNSGSDDPKDSSAYKKLDGQYSQVRDELKSTQKDLKSTKSKLNDSEKDLKKAKEKAEKWDKEQADKKAAEDKAAQEAADKKKAEEEQKQKEAQAQQEAAQQAQKAQETATQPAAPNANTPAAPAPAAPAPAAPAPAPAPAQPQVQPRSGGSAHGGAFCSPEGAQAQSDRSSNILTCRVASDGRLRWKN